MGCSLSVLLKALLAGDSKWHEKKPEESYGGGGYTQNLFVDSISLFYLCIRIVETTALTPKTCNFQHVNSIH